MSGLPDFLANRKKPTIATTVVSSFGTSMPPHVSIKDNRFTLVDGAGNEKPLQTLYLDCVIVDLNEKMTRTYYGSGKYNPDERLPPKCYSNDGIRPSERSNEVQSPTCASCPQSKWGSATSNVTGKGIPACANGIKLAIIVPTDPNKLTYMLRVPPASINAIKNYAKVVKDWGGIDMPDFVTRVEFESQGVLIFGPTPADQGGGYISEEIAKLEAEIWDSKLCDELVGRTDLAGAPAAIETKSQEVKQIAQREPEGRPETAQEAAQKQPGEAPKPRGRPKKADAPAPTSPPFATQQAAAAKPPFLGGATKKVNQKPDFGIKEAPPPNDDLNKMLEATFGLPTGNSDDEIPF